MGIFESKIDIKFIEECQKRLSQVDASLSCLATSIDSLHGAIKLFLEHLVGINPNSLNEGTGEGVISLTRDLLSSIEQNLYTEKLAVLEGVSELLHLLKAKTDNRTKILRHLPTLLDLKIDKYINEFKQKQKRTVKAKTTLKSTVSNGSLGSSVDPDMTDLQQIIQKLQEENDALKHQNEKLTTENDRMQMERKQSEELIQNCKQERDRNAAEIDELKKNNERLQTALENALNKVETFTVQIYHQRRGSLIGLVVEELLNRLKEHLSQDNKDLEVIRCETSDDIQPDKPLLVLCISTSRLGTDAKTAIQGIPELRHSALLIFHHKDQHALPSQLSERILADSEFRSLRGIFDLAYLTGKGMYACDMNSRAITGITELVCKVSEENQPAYVK